VRHETKDTDLLTMRQVCKMIGIGDSTFYRLRKHKEKPLPAPKIMPGGGHRFTRASIQRWIERLDSEVVNA
jgi:excisionase family DNA binding protein